MSKVFPFLFFREFQTLHLFFSDYISFLRTTILIFIFQIPLINIPQIPLETCISHTVFAKTIHETPNIQKNHRLENFLKSTEGRDDWTRLMLAILNGVPAVERVLNQGVRVNIRGTNEFPGVTPLMFASGIGEQVTVELLIERGARLNDTDSQGKTALIYATKKGHLETVRYLIMKGANPNAETNQKWTALMFASGRGHVEILKTLLIHGARIDSQNNLGMSSKMYAAQNGHLKIVKLLLKQLTKRTNGSNPK